MEDLIILILFLVASLVSFLSKKREQRPAETAPQWDSDEWVEFPKTIEHRFDEVLRETPSTAAPTPPTLPQLTITPEEVGVSARTAWSPAPTPALGLLSTTKYSYASIQHGRKEFSIAKEMRSLSSLRKAFVIREILDRPRAFDI